MATATASSHYWPHSTTPPPHLSAEHVETKLRGLALLNRVRVSEFFKDFDPLRSGKITKTQFRRCLDQNLGFRLSDPDYQSLASKYELPSTGGGDSEVNYRQFCEAMESCFNPDKIDGNPAQQIEAFQQNACLDTPTLSRELNQRIQQLLQQCALYYKSRGINIKHCYQDFDRHGRGYVTQSQFHRSFPGPPEVGESDVSLLAHCYYDPSTQLYNYLNFHHDIRTLIDGEYDTFTDQPMTTVAQQKPATDTLQDVFRRIRDVVYQYGIRTTEFFRDHDKLRSGLITENQFVCGLSLCLAERAHLTREDINTVVKRYQINDGRVRYKEFCDLMENAYNEPNLEKRPTVSVHRPLQGYLYKTLNKLNEEEEDQLETVLLQVSRQVKKRRLLLHPYFQDFDRGKGYTRGVTKPQFERLLHFLSITVSPQGMKLLLRKFEDPVNGDINYSAFIQAVDEEYTGHEQVTQQPAHAKDMLSEVTPPTPGLGVRVDVEEVMERLREYVYINRVRVCDHLQDFDPLRCGSITVTRFRQGLTSMGIPHINTNHFKALCDRYNDPQHDNHILWRQFVHDIDRVFDCTPESSYSGKPSLLPEGAVDFSATSTSSQQMMLSSAMEHLRQRVTQRRILLTPTFKDFDKHNSGHITCTQFWQCLSTLNLLITDNEMAVIKMRFSSAKGVNYQQFLSELQQDPPVEDKYQQRLNTLMTVNMVATPPPPPLTARSRLADTVMNSIKTQVCKQRVRVLEFMMDYDKLRSGSIPATSFHRALDLCGFGLSSAEVAALVERYRSCKDPSMVNYTQFSDDVESVFTVKELEKMPTADVKQFVPVEQIGSCQLTDEEEQLLQKCLHRLGERVRVRRIQLYPLFEDYDKIHNGSVTRGQFHRVLSELDMSGLLSVMEFGILYCRFGVLIGGRCDINYNSFCAILEEYAQTRWTDPALQ